MPESELNSATGVRTNSLTTSPSPEDRVQSKDLIAPCLTLSIIKIKDKVEQSRELSSTLPYTSVFVVIKKRRLLVTLDQDPQLQLYYCISKLNMYPVSWGCRLHRLLLCGRVRPPTNRCLGYDTKQSDGEVLVMLELWRTRCTPPLPFLRGSPWPGMVAPDRVLSMGQIELNWVIMQNWNAWNITVLSFKLPTYAKLNCLK